jgi:hypothetical protein
MHNQCNHEEPHWIILSHSEPFWPQISTLFHSVIFCDKEFHVFPYLTHGPGQAKPKPSSIILKFAIFGQRIWTFAKAEEARTLGTWILVGWSHKYNTYWLSWGEFGPLCPKSHNPGAPLKSECQPQDQPDFWKRECFAFDKLVCLTGWSLAWFRVEHRSSDSLSVGKTAADYAGHTHFHQIHRTITNRKP